MTLSMIYSDGVVFGIQNGSNVSLIDDNNLQLFAECLALVKFVDVMTSEDLVVKMSNVFGLGILLPVCA